MNPGFKAPGGATTANGTSNVDYAEVKMLDPIDKIAFIKFQADALRPGTLRLM